MNRKLSLIKLIGVLFVCTNFSAIYAEENFNFSHNGLMFTLTVNAIVLAPEDPLLIRYRVTNLDHQGIVTIFSSSRRADIQVQTPYGVAGNDIGYVSFLVVGQEYIPKNETFSVGLNIPLDAFLVKHNGIIDTATIADGDTLEVRGGFASTVYGIEKPGLEEEARRRWEQSNGAQKGEVRYDPALDVNQDGGINFSDFVGLASNRWILNWEKMPVEAELPVLVYIRRVTADFNRDRQIDFQDFIGFTSTFGTSIEGENYDARSDLDGNGKIEFPDFVMFVQKFTMGM